MVPLNGLMNHIAEMAHAETFFTRHVSTRFAIIAGAFPLELAASLENAIKLPFDAGRTILKLACNTIDLCLDSQSIKNFTDKQPGLIDLFKTALKVVAYAIGAVVTASLGLCRPYDNFRLHVACHLIQNEKLCAAKYAAEQKMAEERLEHEKAMQTHIQNLVLLMRQKAHERESQLAAEMQKYRTDILIPSEITENANGVNAEAQVDFSNNQENYNQLVDDEISFRLLQEHQRIVTAIPVPT